MFNDATMLTVLHAKDIERLKTFLQQKLGLEPVDEQMGMYFYEVGGGKLFIYESSFAGINQATAVCFDVPDVEATAQELKSKGVEFEHYDMPGVSLVGDVHVMEGMGVKSAWLKDTEGNIYNINQMNN